MKSCYGIDLRENRAVAVKAERIRGKYQFKTVSAREVPAGAVSAGSISVKESFARWLESPFVSMTKARKVFPTILDIQLPFPLDECIYEFFDFKKNTDGCGALAAGGRKDALASRLTAYRDNGFDLYVMDHEGAALWSESLREMPETDSGSDDPRIVVNLGPDRSTVVFGRGDRFISAHALRSTDSGALARLLASVFAKPAACRWYFAGESADSIESAQKFMDLAAAEWHGACSLHKDPDEFLARALAVRALESRGLSCNLRKGELVHSYIEKNLRRALLKPVMIVLAAGSILAGANAGAMLYRKMLLSGSNSRFKELASETAGYKITGKGSHALKAVRQKIDQQKLELQPFRAAFSQSLTAIISDIISNGKKSGVQYESITIDDNGKLLIKGSAGEWNACDGLIAVLKNKGLEVDLQRKDMRADERIPFTLKAEGRL